MNERLCLVKKEKKKKEIGKKRRAAERGLLIEEKEGCALRWGRKRERLKR